MKNNRKIIQLQVELKALSKEKDEASKGRIKSLNRELGDLEEKNKALRARLEVEKSSILRLRHLKREVETLKLDMEKAERDGELEKAAELKYGKLPGIKEEIKKREAESAGKTNSLLKEEVGPEEIARVVSQWTGIPVSKMLETEARKLLSMEKSLKKTGCGAGSGRNSYQPGDSPIPGGDLRSGQTHRQFYIFRPHRCGKNGNSQGSGGVFI